MRRLWISRKGGQSRPPPQNTASRPPIGADVPGGPRTGLRLRFQPGVDPEVRAACIRFAVWLRRTYVFPVRVPVYVKAAATVTCQDGEEASAVFFGPDDPAQEPYIRLSAGDYPALRQRWGRDKSLGAILHSLAHELSHYFQWLNHHDVWLSDDPETNCRLERQAVYYADAILDDYAETVDHP